MTHTPRCVSKNMRAALCALEVHCTARSFAEKNATLHDLTQEYESNIRRSQSSTRTSTPHIGHIPCNHSKGVIDLAEAFHGNTPHCTQSPFQVPGGVTIISIAIIAHTMHLFQKRRSGRWPRVPIDRIKNSDPQVHPEILRDQGSHIPHSELRAKP